MKLPDKVDIGYRTFDVVMCDELRNKDDERLYGRIDYETGEISIINGLKPDHAVSVLLHEIVHGLIDEFMIETNGNDEKICDGISAGLVLLLKLNPDIKKLLLEGA